jgi:hypothetical protein
MKRLLACYFRNLALLTVVLVKQHEEELGTPDDVAATLLPTY